MRCDQFAGLPTDAIEFLNTNIKEPIICPTCNCTRPFKTAVAGYYIGMFGEKYDLYRYELKDTGYAEEFVQASPWSSGPVFFLGLKVFNKFCEEIHTYLWPQETIDNE